MKAIVLLMLGLVMCSQAFEGMNIGNECQSSLVKLVSGSTSGESMISKIPQILNKCGLSELSQQFALFEQCIDDLTKAKNVLRQIATQKNKAKFAFEITVLKTLYSRRIQKTCKFLNVVNIQSLLKASNSSGVCLEAGYQLSLDVQTMWGHVIQGNYAVALADFEQFLDDVPYVLDICGDHALADKIRKEFPAACLRSFDKLAKELSKLEHNFEHLQWLVKNWKEIQESFNNVRKTCPVFA